MKTLKISKFGLILLLTLLMSIQIVRSISISPPLPMDLRLNRGDTARIYFNIQTGGSTVKQICSYSYGGIEPLVMSFDEKESELNVGEEKYIYGTISVPADAPIKDYNGQLTASCMPELKQGEVGSIIKRTMIADFIVKVVGTPEEKLITQIPTPPEKREAFPLPFIIIVIVLILAIIGYYFSKKSEKKIIS